MIYRFFVHLMALVSTRGKKRIKPKKRQQQQPRKRAQTTHIPFRKYAWKNSASNNFIAQQQQQQKLKIIENKNSMVATTTKNKYI